MIKVNVLFSDVFGRKKLSFIFFKYLIVIVNVK